MIHYRFLLSLGEGKEKATVQIRVPEKFSLYQLADALLEAIGFDLDHAFGFHSDLKKGPYSRKNGQSFTAFVDMGHAEDASEDDPGVEKTLIGEAFDEGESLLFHFDYGDDWFFLVSCLAIEEGVSQKRKAEVLEIQGVFPEQYPDYDEDYDDDEQEEEE